MNCQTGGRGVRGGTVLVVDDDADVRQLAVEQLRDSGHVVLEAADGHEALRVFDAHPEIDLIFTDVVMPGLDGFKFADVAKSRRPKVKVIYATGYAGRVGEHVGVWHGEILLKPYRGQQLSEAVAQALR